MRKFTRVNAISKSIQAVLISSKMARIFWKIIGSLMMTIFDNAQICHNMSSVCTVRHVVPLSSTTKAQASLICWSLGQCFLTNKKEGASNHRVPCCIQFSYSSTILLIVAFFLALGSHISQQVYAVSNYMTTKHVRYLTLSELESAIEWQEAAADPERGIFQERKLKYRNLRALQGTKKITWECRHIQGRIYLWISNLIKLVLDVWRRLHP